MKALSQFFQSIRVLEFASVLAGPAVGMFFAGLGASVVKIESSGSGGDVTRSWRLPSEDPGQDVSAYFSALNWGKQSVSLDLRSREGREKALQLATEADIVISSFKKGDAERLQVDAKSLRSLNSRLIVGCISGYGPDSARVGYDAVIQAESGFLFLNGPVEGPPVKMPVALTDVLAAHELKEGLLLALLNRELTGEGAEVAVSLFDTAVLSLVNQATNWLVAGVVPVRRGSEHPNIAPYGEIFKSSDGEILLAVGTDKQFSALSEVLKLHALIADERFQNNQSRVSHRKELAALLAPAIVARGSADLLRLLAERDVPAGAIRSVKEVFELPDVAQRLVLAQMDEVGRGYAGIRPFGFALSALPIRPGLSRPPHLGEHNSLYGV